MLNVIILFIVGSILAYVSKYNASPVSVNVGSYIFTDIPLFYVIIISFVTGLILAYVSHLFHDISNSFVLRSKKNEIKKNKDEVLELTKRVHQLELENEKLKHSPAVKNSDPDSF